MLSKIVRTELKDIRYIHAGSVIKGHLYMPADSIDYKPGLKIVAFKRVSTTQEGKRYFTYGGRIYAVMQTYGGGVFYYHARLKEGGIYEDIKKKVKAYVDLYPKNNILDEATALKLKDARYDLFSDFYYDYSDMNTAFDYIEANNEWQTFNDDGARAFSIISSAPVSPDSEAWDYSAIYTKKVGENEWKWQKSIRESLFIEQYEGHNKKYPNMEEILLEDLLKD